MNWLDYILMGILLLSMLAAARKGFSREVIGLVTSLFAIVLAMWFYGVAGSLVAPYTNSPRTANLIGFLMVVICVLVVGGILGSIVSRFMRTIGLSFFDRLLGAAFGLVRGILIAAAALTAFMAFGPQAEAETAPAAVLHSRIAPYVLEASRAFVAVAPMELKSSFSRQYEAMKSALHKTPAPGGDSRD